VNLQGHVKADRTSAWQSVPRSAKLEYTHSRIPKNRHKNRQGVASRKNALPAGAGSVIFAK